MAPRQLASDTAHSIRRRLEAVADRERARRGPSARAAQPEPADQRADDANLDALRGELVRELDRLAATDHGGSAGFRRG